MRGPSGVASDNRHACNHRRLGASVEGRLAWPNLPSASGHLCKPTRPQGACVVLPRPPFVYQLKISLPKVSLASIRVCAA